MAATWMVQPFFSAIKKNTSNEHIVRNKFVYLQKILMICQQTRMLLQG